ncbi:MAG: hypothetical protein KJ583_07715 [Nanoarchaeota archaeon]|nr:hypothetical protein [Nanoarchaeota archaeon]MBU1269408.1 hypothetical protein [Nanoarchaeota archaeon]MBU1605173.1 hypothetical protein [Nanoarchaeota archaeon]MBU2442905.1 hypothetical protein [Nanoarchaeota archaeon]
MDPLNTTAQLAFTDVMVSEQTAKSLFDYLPQNMFTEFIVKINSAMSETLVQYIPDHPLTHFFITNPLIVLIFIFAASISIAIFLDFIVDAWKIPFAVAVDIIDLMAIAMPGLLDFAAAVGSFLIFAILASDCPKFAQYGFGAIGAAKAVLPIRIASMLPINTALMLVVTVIDRK